MQQFSETHLLAHLVEHATLSESGPIGGMLLYLRQPLVTYSGMPKICHYFTVACPSQLKRQVSRV